MSELVISRAFIRKLTAGIEDAYGSEVKHTAVIGMVASALGWRQDALMHKLKSSEAKGPEAGTSASDSDVPFEAPVDDHTFDRWALRRKWRHHEQALVELLGAFEEEDEQEFRRDTLVTCIAICRLVLRDIEGALSVIEGMPETDARVSLILALADYRRNGASDAVEDRIATSLLHFKGDLPGFTAPMIAREFPVTTIPNSGPDSATFGSYASQMPRDELGGYLLKVAAGREDDLRAKPAVPISESVMADGIVCLFDGEKRLMLHRYVSSRYGMTPEAYRAYWKLPADYPMVAPGYSREKRAVAISQGIDPQNS